MTETYIVSPRAINETRFQFMHASSSATGDSALAARMVQGAFSGGGSQIGNSGTTANRWELSNISSFTRGTHALRWGGRVRQVFLDSTNGNNFGGTFTFLGGGGPRLDANNLAVTG